MNLYIFIAFNFTNIFETLSVSSQIQLRFKLLKMLLLLDHPSPQSLQEIQSILLESSTTIISMMETSGMDTSPFLCFAVDTLVQVSFLKILMKTAFHF
jgi:hypothetical protein